MDVPQIVVDTNVLVSALRSRRGASYQLLSKVGTGLFDIHLSVPLVLEYEHALLKQLDDLLLDEDDVDVVLDYLCKVGQHWEIYYLWRPALGAPEDEFVLELAVRAGCDAIVTFNERDFEAARVFDVEILRPASFLKRCEEEI